MHRSHRPPTALPAQHPRRVDQPFLDTWRTALGGLLLALALGGCGDDPLYFGGPFPGGADANGSDGGAADSGPDAGADDASDAGTDSSTDGAGDTGGDAGDSGSDAGPQDEICDNFIDDDRDGRTDCLDPDCEAHSACQGAFCGDGNIDVERGEACDDGEHNSNTAADACRSNCQLPRCGDGTVDSSEDCEPGAASEVTCPALGYDSGEVTCSAACELGVEECEYDCDPLPSDGELDLDLRTARWTGEVLLDGARLPAETTPDDCVGSSDEIVRGFVRVTNLDTQARLNIDLGRSGRVDIDQWLPAGRYRADYMPAPGCWNPAYTEWLLPEALPRIEGAIVTEFELDGDVDFDLDLRTGRWTGEVLLNGARLPTEPTPNNCVGSSDEIIRGYVRITNLDTQATQSFELGRSGAVNFDYWLPEGRYRADYRPSGGCWDPTYSTWLLPAALPRVEGVIATDIELRGDRSADLNLRTGRWTGEVLLDGRSLPVEPTPDDCVGSSDEIIRGYVRITNLETNDAESFALGRTGAAEFDYWLPVGQHSAEHPSASVCWDPTYSEWLLPSALPRLEGVIEATLELTGDRDSDLNLRTGRWTGEVLLDGATLPPESTPDNCVGSSDEIIRGAIRITNLDTNDAEAFELGRTGAADFVYWLPVGRYRVTYQPSPGCWDPTYSEWLLPSALPRLEGVLFESVEHSGSRTQDLDLRTGRWTGQVLMDGRPLPNELTADDCVGSSDEIVRGFVRITNLQTQASQLFDLGRTGAVNFSYWLPVGHYRVDYQPAGGCWDPTYSEWLLPTAMPRMGGVIEFDLDHRGDRTSDLDLRTQHWTGAVLLDSARLPNEVTPDDCVGSSDEIVRGFVRITSLENNAVIAVDLARSGAVTFDHWLPRGRYRADYRPAGGCWNPSYTTWRVPAALPRIEGVIEACREVVR